MSKCNLSFLVFVNDEPFCVVYGSEEDAQDLVANKKGYRYEPIVTVVVQYGLERKSDA